jgi:hypothetical protein
MREEIVPADRRTRTLMLALLAVGVVLVVLSHRIGDLAAGYDASKDPEQNYREVVERFKLIATLGAIPPLAFAAYFATAGLRTLQCGAWPPYGMKVPWSLVRRKGRYAVAMGVGNLVIAAFFLAQVGVSLWSAWLVAK